jgi:hypothetical protein
VTLRFGGRPERLVVPWTALRAFADPSADFGFRLQPPAGEAGEEASSSATTTEPEAPAGDPAQASPFRPLEPAAEAGDDKVVDFGAFRRRSDN